VISGASSLMEMRTRGKESLHSVFTVLATDTE
jgi:hypothetical protein